MNSQSRHPKIYPIKQCPNPADAVPAPIPTTLEGVQQEIARVYGDIRANRISSLSGKRMIDALGQLVRSIESAEIGKRVSDLEKSTVPHTRSSKILAGVHQQLKVMERLRASIEAASRQDTEEFKRIEASCPREEAKLYQRARDHTLTCALNIQLIATWHAGNACTLLMFIELSYSGGSDSTRAALVEHVREYRIQEEVFDRFSHAIGIAPETLKCAIEYRPLRVISGALDVAQIYGDTEPPEDRVLEYFDVMTEPFKAAGLI